MILVGNNFLLQSEAELNKYLSCSRESILENFFFSTKWTFSVLLHVTLNIRGLKNRIYIQQILCLSPYQFNCTDVESSKQLLYFGSSGKISRDFK